MSIKVIVALIVAVPLILFPVAFVWYLNFAGVFASMKGARTARKAQKVAGKSK